MFEKSSPPSKPQLLLEDKVPTLFKFTKSERFLMRIRTTLWSFCTAIALLAVPIITISVKLEQGDISFANIFNGKASTGDIVAFVFFLTSCTAFMAITLLKIYSHFKEADFQKKWDNRQVDDVAILGKLEKGSDITNGIADMLLYKKAFSKDIMRDVTNDPQCTVNDEDERKLLISIEKFKRANSKNIYKKFCSLIWAIDEITQATKKYIRQATSEDFQKHLREINVYYNYMEFKDPTTLLGNLTIARNNLKNFITAGAPISEHDEETFFNSAWETINSLFSWLHYSIKDKEQLHLYTSDSFSEYYETNNFHYRIPLKLKTVETCFHHYKNTNDLISANFIKIFCLKTETDILAKYSKSKESIFDAKSTYAQLQELSSFCDTLTIGNGSGKFRHFLTLACSLLNKSHLKIMLPYVDTDTHMQKYIGSSLDSIIKCFCRLSRIRPNTKKPQDIENTFFSFRDATIKLATSGISYADTESYPDFRTDYIKERRELTEEIYRSKSNFTEYADEHLVETVKDLKGFANKTEAANFVDILTTIEARLKLLSFCTPSELAFLNGSPKEFSDVLFNKNRYCFATSRNPNNNLFEKATFDFGYVGLVSESYGKKISHLENLQKTNFKAFFQQYQTLIQSEKCLLNSILETKLIYSFSSRIRKACETLDNLNNALNNIKSSAFFEQICKEMDNKFSKANSAVNVNPNTQLKSTTAINDAKKNIEAENSRS